jgi:hypothetical protein
MRSRSFLVRLANLPPRWDSLACRCWWWCGWWSPLAALRLLAGGLLLDPSNDADADADTDTDAEGVVVVLVVKDATAGVAGTEADAEEGGTTTVEPPKLPLDWALLMVMLLRLAWPSMLCRPKLLTAGDSLGLGAGWWGRKGLMRLPDGGADSSSSPSLKASARWWLVPPWPLVDDDDDDDDGALASAGVLMELSTKSLKL